MTREEYLSLIEDVGRELARRGMTSHVELARQAWRAASIGAASIPGWRPDDIRAWAGRLQIREPHLPVRPWGWHCPCPRRDEWTTCSWAGGHETACRCGERWLVWGP